MKSYEEIIAFLESKIPASEIWEREGGGGKTLSYFEAWWTNDLLNQAFGNLGWSSETVQLEEIHGLGKDPKERQLYGYKARTKISAMVRMGENAFVTITHDGWGACMGLDLEMALKGAESDSFKRAAVKFGKRLGLALYDKSRGSILDDKPQAQSPAPTPQPAGVKPQVLPAPKVAPVAAKEPVHVLKAQAGTPTREQINSLIRSTASVAFSKKVLVDDRPFDLAAMKLKIAGYGADKTENLTDPQAYEILEFLQTLVM